MHIMLVYSWDLNPDLINIKASFCHYFISPLKGKAVKKVFFEQIFMCHCGMVLTIIPNFHTAFCSPSSALTCTLSLNMLVASLMPGGMSLMNGGSFGKSNCLEVNSVVLPGAGKPGKGAQSPRVLRQPEGTELCPQVTQLTLLSSVCPDQHKGLKV